MKALLLATVLLATPAFAHNHDRRSEDDWHHGHHRYGRRRPGFYDRFNLSFSINAGEPQEHEHVWSDSELDDRGFVFISLPNGHHRRCEAVETQNGITNAFGCYRAGHYEAGGWEPPALVDLQCFRSGTCETVRILYIRG